MGHDHPLFHHLPSIHLLFPPFCTILVFCNSKRHLFMNVYFEKYDVFSIIFGCPFTSLALVVSIQCKVQCLSSLIKITLNKFKKQNQIRTSLSLESNNSIYKIFDKLKMIMDICNFKVKKNLGICRYEELFFKTQPHFLVKWYQHQQHD